MSSDPSAEATEFGWAVRVRSLSKRYPIYDHPRDRLKQALWRGRRSYYRPFWALRDVDFEVARGEAVGIVDSRLGSLTPEGRV